MSFQYSEPHKPESSEPTVIRRVDGFWCIRCGSHYAKTPYEDRADCNCVVAWLKGRGATKVQVDLQ